MTTKSKKSQNVVIENYDEMFNELFTSYKITHNDENEKHIRDVAYKNRNRRDVERDVESCVNAFKSLTCCAKSKIDISNVLTFIDDVRYIAHRETMQRRHAKRNNIN